jgi:hypothetical protein
VEWPQVPRAQLNVKRLRAQTTAALLCKMQNKLSYLCELLHRWMLRLWLPACEVSNSVSWWKLYHPQLHLPGRLNLCRILIKFVIPACGCGCPSRNHFKLSRDIVSLNKCTDCQCLLRVKSYCRYNDKLLQIITIAGILLVYLRSVILHQPRRKVGQHVFVRKIMSAFFSKTILSRASMKK